MPSINSTIRRIAQGAGLRSSPSSIEALLACGQPTGTNFSRLTSMTYPNGRQLDYVYNSGIDTTISRVSGLSDDSGSGAGNLQDYLYLGLNTIVQETDGNGIGLSYIHQPGDTLSSSDGGDRYTGLDRFGRVIDQFWVNGSGSAIDRFQYGYDQDSNVLYKTNLVNSAESELYHANGVATNSGYDSLNRLTAFSRGTLSASGNNGTTLDQITSPSITNTWSLDALGNQTSTQGGSQTRTFNAQNQITGISGLTTPTYDNNGNITKDQAGTTYSFDPWNRIAKVNGTYAYSYDALGRRIYEGTTGHDLYYSTAGNVLEERSGLTVTDQYVWGLAYVNQLVLRDDNSTSGSYGKTGSGLGERLYVQQDANWNVTALVDTADNVKERFVYDPYGARTGLNASWGATSDAYSWLYGFQDGRQDPTTGLVHFQARDLNTATGTWMQQDPGLRALALTPTIQESALSSPAIAQSVLNDPLLMRRIQEAQAGYVNGFDRYEIEGANPLNRVDPSGLSWWGALGGALTGGLVGGAVAIGVVLLTGGAALPVIGVIGAIGAVDGTVLGGAFGARHKTFGQGALRAGVPAGLFAGGSAPLVYQAPAIFAAASSMLARGCPSGDGAIDIDIINEIKALPDGANLTPTQISELAKNIDAVLNKSLPAKAASCRLQDIIDLFNNDPRFRFISQVPGAVDKINQALGKYGGGITPGG